MAEVPESQVSGVEDCSFLSRSPSIQLLTNDQSNQPSVPPSLNGFEESLSRLSNKPGVIATIILDAENGAILKKKSMSNVSPLFNALQLSPTSSNAAQDPSALRSDVDEFATMVWRFMSAAGSLVHNLDSEVC